MPTFWQAIWTVALSIDRRERRPIMNEELRNPLPESTPGEAEQEKPDLFDYLESLPDVEDPFEPSEPEPKEEPMEKSDLQLLAEFIRARAAAGLITPKSTLIQEDPELEAVLSELAQSEDYSDIRTEQGQKDIYYYSTPVMAVNYAHMAMLAEEKDYCRTIADIVRRQCKIGPACTKVYFFTAHPYNMTRVQIDATLTLLRRREEYQDIRETTAFNGERFLYSADILSDKYAKALADFCEEGEHNM